MNTQKKLLYEHHCKVLNVSVNATTFVVKSTYRNWCKIHRPDLRAESAKKFNEINLAYNFIIQHHKEYNANKQKNSHESQVDFCTWSTKTGTKHRRVSLQVPFKTAILGGTLSCPITRAELCEACDWSKDCDLCKNTRVIARQRTLTVKLDVNTQDGASIWIRNSGNYDPITRTKEDILIHVQVQEDELGVYQRKQNRLYMNVHVDYTLALLGGVIQIPLLHGGYHIQRLDPNSLQTHTIEIPGQGIELHTGLRDSLFCIIQVQKHSELTNYEKTLLQQLYRYRKQHALCADSCMLDQTFEQKQEKPKSSQDKSVDPNTRYQ